jgi:hypothetical protein
VRFWIDEVQDNVVKTLLRACWCHMVVNELC